MDNGLVLEVFGNVSSLASQTNEEMELGMQNQDIFECILQICEY